MDNSGNIKISDDKVKRLSMAVAELRNAGICDGVIRTHLSINAAGPLATPEELDIIIQVFNKYGIDDIKKEDFFAHNQSQSDEMRELISQLTENLEEELEGIRRALHRQESIEQSDETLQMQQEEGPEVEPSEVEISQEKIDKLRMAIQEARKQGINAINYIYTYETSTNLNWGDFEKWAEISEKYGISQIMGEDYNLDKGYSGYSKEMHDIINNLTQEETVSLTELGEKSYQHFGKRIAEKLRQAVNTLKSRFFSKDKDKTDDLTNER